jgi:hypothetical protein
LKKYPTSVFDREVWREIYLIFLRERVPCLPSVSGDWVQPIFIETSKRGVEISGEIGFVPTGNYMLYLILSRPSFPSIESVSVSKLRRAVIADSRLDDCTLYITVKIPSAG